MTSKLRIEYVQSQLPGDGRNWDPGVTDFTKCSTVQSIWDNQGKPAD